MKEEELRIYSAELAYTGQSYEQIELALSESSASPDVVKLVMKDINDYIVQYQLAVQERDKSRNEMLMGGLLLAMGLGVTGYTYFSSNSAYVLAYGAILGGAWILKKGYKKYNLPIEEYIRRQSRSKFKRFKK